MIKIGNRPVGPEHPPLIVAELSGNHNQNFETALQFIDAVKKTGAHAIKLQTYTADTITMDVDRPEFQITEESSLWKGQSLYQLYEKAHTPWEWHADLFKRCQELGLIAFSTPFDETAVDFLEDLNVPCYKIASAEITHIPLIKKTASTKKPLILSTGSATLEEMDEAVTAARDAGCKELILLKTTNAKPASPTIANLRTLPAMAERFGTLVGLSDHILGNGPAIASIALGCCLIEKHFTLDRSAKGIDAPFSLEPSELHYLVQETYQAWQSLGKVHFGPTKEEEHERTYFRSLYFNNDLQAGQKIAAGDIKAIRPALGLPPKYYDEVIGKTLAHDVKRGEPLKWEDFTKR